MTTAHISYRAANSELQEALELVDMEAWLDREGIEYKLNRGSRGLQLNVQECPVCGSSKWKVYLNAENGLGNCFDGDCEVKFNKWKFISAHLGTPHRDTIEHIKQVAKEQGWRPPRAKEIATTSTGEVKMPESIALPHNGRNLKYLDARGITSAIASYFELRYSHAGRYAYNDGGKTKLQDYANRVLIPIFDLEGELVTFQGRDTTGTSDRKYLFPPGLTSTGAHLYNGHNAWGAEHICLGEGVFDVAAIKIALDEDVTLRNVVAVGTFGKHLSHGDDASQFSKLLALKQRGLKTITIMWDGEDRAIDDAIKTGLLLLTVGFKVRIAILPQDKDPNEVPPSVVRDAFNKAINLTPATAVRLKLKKR
jgi:DNA primase